MQEFIVTGMLGIGLIGLCSLIIYELLRFAWGYLPRLKTHPRMRVLMMVVCIFSGHIANIWIFGAVYYVLYKTGMGFLTGTDIASGQFTVDLIGCIYYSAVTYSTLGIGDITPEGSLRMITSVEALTGFMMIGWTVTFTYLAMEKFWGIAAPAEIMG